MEDRQIILKEALPSAVMNNPYPAGVPLRFSRVNTAIVIHHPDNLNVTKVIKGHKVASIFGLSSVKEGIEIGRILFNDLDFEVNFNTQNYETTFDYVGVRPTAL